MEEWKNMLHFENFVISTCGNIKNLDWHNSKQEKIVPFTKTKEGHLRCRIFYNDDYYNLSVHRMVALAFIPIPEKYKNIPVEKLDVHHINFIPYDNRVENLCWLTKLEHRRIHKNRPVFRYNLDGVFIDEWSSAREIQNKLGFCDSNIYRCCVGDIKTVHGFQFSFEKHKSLEPIEDKNKRRAESKCRAIGMYSKDLTLEATFKSTKEASEITGISRTAINNNLNGRSKTAGGHIFKYKEPSDI